jgi:hypothetical protein
MYRMKRTNDNNDSGAWSRCIGVIESSETQMPLVKGVAMPGFMDRNMSELNMTAAAANLTKKVAILQPVGDDSSIVVDAKPNNINDTKKLFEGELDPAKGPAVKCQVSSKPFIMYYLILLFLLCFATPVLITTSLNVFISSAVKHTTYEVTI